MSASTTVQGGRSPCRPPRSLTSSLRRYARKDARSCDDRGHYGARNASDDRGRISCTCRGALVPPQLCFTPRVRCRIRRRGRLHAVVGGHLVCHRADLSQLLSLRIVCWRNWVLTLDDIVTMLYEMRVCLRCQRHWWSTLRLTWAGSSLIMARN